MRGVRSLPLRLPPVEGEALDSWMETLSARLRMPAGELLTALGLEADGSRAPSVMPWLTALLPREADCLARATGVAPERLRAMTLESFDRQCLFIDRDRRKVDHSMIWGRHVASGSRFCPQCLAESQGRWPLAWRLGWSYACLVHRLLLVDYCPKCRARQRRRPGRSTFIPRPGQCSQLAPKIMDNPQRHRCLHPLHETETMRFDVGHPALRAQRDILDVIEKGVGAFGVYAQRPQPAATVLADLRALARRILFHMPAERMSRLVPPELAQAHFVAREFTGPLYETTLPAPRDAGRAAPAHAATAAAGITAAWSILRHGDCGQAAELMREVSSATGDRGYGISPSLVRYWGQHTSPLLEGVYLKALAPALRPSRALRYRTASPIPTIPATGAPQVTRRARKIPSRIWPLWAVRLDPDSRVRDHLEASLAASLLLVDSKIELPAAVRKLGALIDQPILTHALQALRDDPHYEGIQLALIRLAGYLDAHKVPIDYAQRRRLDYTDLLPPSEWDSLCHRVLLPPGAGARHQAVRCYLFEKISGLPHRRIPDRPRDTVRSRSTVRRVPYVLTRPAMEELDEVARAFLTRHNIHDEPVTWAPPAELLDGLDLPRPDPALVDLARLHQHVLDGTPPQYVGQALNTDLRTLRYLLGEHPVPGPDPTSQSLRALVGSGLPVRLLLARKTVSPQQLEDLYVRQDKPFTEIARITGCHRKVLAALADEYGLARRSTPSAKRVDWDWLYEQYIGRRRTDAQIAQEMGICTATVGKWRRDHGIPPRPAAPGARARAAARFAAAPPILKPATDTVFGRRQLRTFLDVAAFPTLTLACRTLGVGPPSVTGQIQRLEKTLGASLLVRAARARPMRLTPFGQEVLEAARAFADQLDGASGTRPSRDTPHGNS
ncbi:TniQ family protein [Streptomyces sp. NBC_00280]|uniref:TniQ family protein n=1 Tax=Streptomyces sp. NBC_00280 TaxID=2975699 RepID=UPI0032543690